MAFRISKKRDSSSFWNGLKIDSEAPPAPSPLRGTSLALLSKTPTGLRCFFRLRFDLEAGREAARIFWKSEVLKDDRPREAWQLEQWESAVQWYLNWLGACAEAQADHRSLPERLRVAVNSAGSRRGLKWRTKQCYGAWAARYASFAEGEREAIQVETATQFLTSVVNDEDNAYATQRQALNALAFFLIRELHARSPLRGTSLALLSKTPTGLQRFSSMSAE